MGDVPGCDVTCSTIAMCLLIIEKDVSLIGFQKFSLIEPTKKDGFINSNIPGAQGTNNTFVCRSRTRRHQSRANGRLISRKSLLQLLSRKQRLPGASGS